MTFDHLFPRADRIPEIGFKQLYCKCGSRRVQLIQTPEISYKPASDSIDMRIIPVGNQFFCAGCKKPLNPKDFVKKVVKGDGTEPSDGEKG